MPVGLVWSSPDPQGLESQHKGANHKRVGNTDCKNLQERYFLCTQCAQTHTHARTYTQKQSLFPVSHCRCCCRPSSLFFSKFTGLSPEEAAGFRTRCSRSFPPRLPAPPSARGDRPRRVGGRSFRRVPGRGGPVGRRLLCCPRDGARRRCPAPRSRRVWSSGWWAGRPQAAPAQATNPTAAAAAAGSG